MDPVEALPEAAKWAGGGVVGAFVAGVLALAWGDRRYVRRAECEVKGCNATEALARHETAGHPAVTASLANIATTLAAIKVDLGWIKGTFSKRPCAAVECRTSDGED